MAANITVTYTGFSTEAQTAFQHAVDIWEALLNTSRTITINATWSPATNPNNLGSAGASSNWRNFSGAPAPDTFWPQPLAETLCDCDLGTDPDINANFNSDRSDWYFGTDGNTPAGEYDLVTVVLHEIGHGLGFSGGATVDGSGIGSVGLGEDLYPKYYDLFVKNVSIGVYGGYPNPSELMGDVLQGSGNLLWNGANAVAENGGVEPELYDPNPWNGGSSYSHFAESYYTAGNVNSLMTPFLSGAEAAHHPGPVTLGLLEDLGWSVNNTCDTVGCTDNSACNYDSDACFDDGTCDYGLWYIPLDVAASFTPMTQACSTPSGYTLADQDCAQAVIDGDTYCINTDWDNICMEAYNDCLYGEGCDWYIPDVVSGGPAVWACEAPVGYSIADQPCAQEIILADDWCVDNTWDSLCNNAYIACCPLGCIDSAACNYDSAACQDDSSCTYPGCNDPIACNYDSAAGCDDGSCTYLDSPVTDMTTYDWTLSWDSDCDGDPDETIVYFNSDQSWGVSSDAGTWSLCSGFYMHDYNSGPTTYEGSWDGTGFTGTFDTIDSDWSGCFTLYPIIPGCTDSTAFSYDNKYFGYVGKPSLKGLIHLFKLDYVESDNKLLVTDFYLNRKLKNAAWVCGFSKTGYFATYDSNPVTYLLKVDEELFKYKTDEIELRENTYNSKSNISHQYDKWNKINGKNFLCFSPSGEYLALSEQGYEPLTLGGYGHQESNAVHIANTETVRIIDSFTGHGEKIKYNKKKKVTFVAFSEDEKRIMTLSSDGVVVIRNLKLKGETRDSKKEEIPAANNI